MFIIIAIIRLFEGEGHRLYVCYGMLEQKKCTQGTRAACPRCARL